MDCMEIMPLEWLRHSTKCQINRYLLDYINNFLSVSCKNVTSLLSVIVQWVAILVHEVASLLRFDTVSLDGWFLTFQRLIVASTSGWSSPRHYDPLGGCCGTECYNVTRLLSGGTLLWELHIWKILGSSQPTHWVSWLHVLWVSLLLRTDPRMVPWFRPLSLPDSLHCIIYWSCLHMTLCCLISWQHC